MGQSGQIIFLGTGTSQGVPIIGCACDVCMSKNPKDLRTRSSIQFLIGQTRIQIDTGPDFRAQMLREKLDHIDAVFYTHEHQDHIAGLDDLRPLIFKTKKAMPIFALPRVMERIRKAFHYAFEENPYPGAPKLEAHEISGLDPIFINDVCVLPIPILHGALPILGYRVGSAAYITDVKSVPDASLALLKDLDVLIFDALHHRDHHGHCTLEEALEWSKIINAKNTYLIHMSHHMGTHSSVESQLPENVRLSYDGLQLSFRA
jgi:phosphoribosyl 1,2-cyclic phosphate phosphodiesterase